MLRKSQGTGHQHGSVVGLRRVSAESDDVADGRSKFLLGQSDLSREVVQITNERRHDLLDFGSGARSSSDTTARVTSFSCSIIMNGLPLGLTNTTRGFLRRIEIVRLRGLSRYAP